MGVIWRGKVSHVRGRHVKRVSCGGVCHVEGSAICKGGVTWNGCHLAEEGCHLVMSPKMTLLSLLLLLKTWLTLGNTNPTYGSISCRHSGWFIELSLRITIKQKRIIY